MKEHKVPKIYVFLLELILGILILAVSSISLMTEFEKANALRVVSKDQTSAMLYAESLAEKIKSESQEEVHKVIYYDENWQIVKNEKHRFSLAVKESKEIHASGILHTYKIIVYKHLEKVKSEIYQLEFKKYRHTQKVSSRRGR